MNNFQDKANFIWQVADDILRGVFKRHEYGDAILPFVVLRRLDCVLEPNKDEVIRTYKKFKDQLPDPTQVVLQASGGIGFFNTSFFDLRRLAQDAKNIELNFNNYINGFSKNVREILENFQVDKLVNKLAKNDLLYLMVDKFTEIDLHPDRVKNHEMGYIFEELLRRFSEMSNETAGEHYTPREVIRLMVNLLFTEHGDDLKGKGIVRSIYDPACGTGGMLSIAKEHIQTRINPDIQDIYIFGQEVNEQTFAIAKSDVLITGGEADNIQLGSSFTEDKFRGKRFDYMLSNPPFGVSWKKEQKFIKEEAKDPNGRFHAGLPRVSDGAMLFLLHMISKAQPTGSRIAIIHNGSPLFTGDAGSGESDIRKWIIESDWLEAIVALPTELFFNTGIATYVWVVTNKKPAHRKGKVQLINAVNFFEKMRKSLGHKRKYITEGQIRQITEIYTDFAQGEHCKIFDNEDFGFTKVVVERPMMKNGKVVKAKGKPKPDTKLRDYEKIPLKQDVDEYFKREVLPHVPDAWMDRSKDKIGYEINFTKYFYKYQPLRPLTEIKADILKLEAETQGLLEEILD